MLRRQSWSRLQVQAVLLVVFILALAVPGRAADTGPLPAQNWNRENLKQIEAAAVKPLTFAVFGDNRGEHPAVFESLLKEVDRDPSLSFGIHLGDMVINADLDKYRTFFQEVRLELHKPLLSVIGNHELYGDRGLELYREIFGPDDYSFQIDRNYFIVVDDAAKEGMDPEQLRWLEAELQKSQAAQTRLVFLHVPLFDPRGGENHHCLRPELASRLLVLFKKYQVTHVFAAHIHSYYLGAWDGVPYTITGGAGAKLYNPEDQQHAFYHYLKVTLQGNQVKIKVQPLPGPAGP
ncbi:MAG: metallophosphoesterase [Deltaproteobacteria bacterium]|nr:metallophosphoesterase [Deltaproteobacteria bacterium]